MCIRDSSLTTAIDMDCRESLRNAGYCTFVFCTFGLDCLGSAQLSLDPELILRCFQICAQNWKQPSGTFVMLVALRWMSQGWRSRHSLTLLLCTDCTAVWENQLFQISYSGWIRLQPASWLGGYLTPHNIRARWSGQGLPGAWLLAGPSAAASVAEGGGRFCSRRLPRRPG